MAIGTSKQDVECLLGEPDYSPTRGTFYYYAEEMIVSNESGMKTSQGLGISYLDPNIDPVLDDALTDQLMSKYLGPIGE